MACKKNSWVLESNRFCTTESDQASFLWAFLIHNGPHTHGSEIHGAHFAHVPHGEAPPPLTWHTAGSHGLDIVLISSADAWAPGEGGEREALADAGEMDWMRGPALNEPLMKSTALEPANHSRETAQVPDGGQHGETQQGKNKLLTFPSLKNV